MLSKIRKLCKCITGLVFDPLILFCFDWRPTIAWRCPRTGMLVNRATAIRVEMAREMERGEHADVDEHAEDLLDIPAFLRRQAD